MGSTKTKTKEPLDGQADIDGGVWERPEVEEFGETHNFENDGILIGYHLRTRSVETELGSTLAHDFRLEDGKTLRSVWGSWDLDRKLEAIAEQQGVGNVLIRIEFLNVREISGGRTVKSFDVQFRPKS